MSGNEKEALTPGSETEPETSKVQRSRKQRCLRALYNPDNAKICGRTWKSWLGLWCYYIFVYCLVGALFAGLIIGDHKLRDKNKPEHNLYVFQPFLQEPGMIAYPKGDKKVLAQINVKKADDNIKDIKDFLESYYPAEFDVQECGKGDTIKKCVLKTDEATLGPCSPDKDKTFGYSSTNPEPCVLLTLNKIWGWMPKLYKERPSDLSPDANFSTTSMPVTCERWPDLEKTYSGNFEQVNVYPSTGFSQDCFPFCGKQREYYQPFVMVKFKGLTAEEIGVLCVLYAENIKDSRKKHTKIWDRIGSIAFILNAK